MILDNISYNSKMTEIIDGKAISKKVLEELKTEVDKLKEKNIIPCLAVILIGSDPASKIYVKNKENACNKIGVESKQYNLDENIKEEELLDLINKLNNDDSIDGILLQSPIPKHLNIARAFAKIAPNKDVDGFNPVNVGMLSMGFPVFIPCTPLGVMRLLKEYNIEIEGKNCTVIGRSNIVGKPMSALMLNKNATVTTCHSKTKDLKEVLLNSDIIVSAVGKPEFITSDMIKKDAVLIDVAITRSEDGKLYGDFDFDNVKELASYITPVPGGVGPMTISMLMNNVILACKNRR